jgi:hypothetical protein
MPAAAQQQTYTQLAQNLDPSWVKGKWRPRSMTLQTIKNDNRNLYQEPRETNKLSDISGAQPKRMREFNNGKSDSTSLSDIAGAQPRRLHVGLNKPSNFLVNDIDGAQPASRIFQSRRCVNPLSPKYELPSFKVPPPPSAKFVRDSFVTTGLEGAQPRKPIQFATRDNINVADIVGATPNVIKVNPRVAGDLKQGYEPVSCTPCVMDIAKEPHRSIQGTDPMRPVYIMHDVRIEDDLGSYPRRAKAPREPFYSLLTADISGAKSSTGYRCFPHIEKRKDFRQINDLSDVQGATADTYQRGLKSKRVTDPLDPRYVNLDGILATSRTARRKMSKVKRTPPILPVEVPKPQSVRTSSSTGRSSTRSQSRPVNNQEENISDVLLAQQRFQADHLRCGVSGLAPVDSDEAAHPNGRSHFQDTPFTHDHFGHSMVLEEGCSNDEKAPKQLSPLYLSGTQDHLSANMIPEVGAELESHHIRITEKSKDQKDHINNLADWGLGGLNRATFVQLLEKQGGLFQKVNSRRASESDMAPRLRAATMRPETSHRARSSRSGPVMRSQTSSRRPSTRAGVLGGRLSVTSRSASSLRRGSGSDTATGQSSSARPTTAAPHQARALGATGSRLSSSRSASTRGSALSHREISQIEADRRSVADLPDSVIG